MILLVSWLCSDVSALWSVTWQQSRLRSVSLPHPSRSHPHPQGVSAYQFSELPYEPHLMLALFNIFCIEFFQWKVHLGNIFSSFCYNLQLESLQNEAERLEEQKPEEAQAIREKIAEINNVWMDLKDMVMCWSCLVSHFFHSPSPSSHTTPIFNLYFFVTCIDKHLYTFVGLCASETVVDHWVSDIAFDDSSKSVMRNWVRPGSFSVSWEALIISNNGCHAHRPLLPPRTFLTAWLMLNDCWTSTSSSEMRSTPMLQSMRRLKNLAIKSQRARMTHSTCFLDRYDKRQVS